MMAAAPDLSTTALVALLCCLIARGAALVDQERQEPTPKAPWNATWTDNLKRSILSGYDKFARPSHHRISTNVSLSLTLTHVELNDFSGVMVVHGWIKMAWNDEKLKWNSSDFGGLEVLHIADHEIWQPDIVQYNSASGSSVDQYGNTNCLVSERGNVLWVPPTKLTAFCNLDLSKWPDDEHTCDFIFGSWTYDSIQIYLQSDEVVDDEGNIKLQQNYEVLVENVEWRVVNVKYERHEKTYPCCADAIYASIVYRVTVRRRGGAARAALLRAPAAAAALLALLGHALPPASARGQQSHYYRLPLAAAPPALASLALLFVAQQLPQTGETPDMLMFYSVALYLVCASSVVSIIAMNLASARKTLPWTVRRLLCSRTAGLLCLPKVADASTGEELQGTNAGGSGGSGGMSAEEGAQMLSSVSHHHHQTPVGDWFALATALDRIFLVVLLVAFLVTFWIYC